MPRLLPDAEALVLALLRQGLPGVRVAAEWESDYLQHLPFVWLDVQDLAEQDPQRSGNCLATVQCFSTDRKSTRDLAEAVRSTLWVALRDQTETAYGHLVRYRKPGGPTFIPLDVTGARRSVTTYELGTRFNRA